MWCIYIAKDTAFLQHETREIRKTGKNLHFCTKKKTNWIWKTFFRFMPNLEIQSKRVQRLERRNEYGIALNLRIKFRIHSPSLLFEEILCVELLAD